MPSVDQAENTQRTGRFAYDFMARSKTRITWVRVRQAKMVTVTLSWMESK